MFEQFQLITLLPQRNHITIYSPNHPAHLPCPPKRFYNSGIIPNNTQQSQIILDFPQRFQDCGGFSWKKWDIFGIFESILERADSESISSAFFSRCRHFCYRKRLALFRQIESAKFKQQRSNDKRRIGYSVGLARFIASAGLLMLFIVVGLQTQRKLRPDLMDNASCPHFLQ